MTRRREALLIELEIGPIWRLRTASARPPAESAADRMPVAPPSAAAEPADAADGGPLFAPATNDALSVRGVDSAEGGVVRDASIAGMDWVALKRAVAGCQACGLCRTRNRTVFGIGDESADLMIVGEAPGAEEDAQGEPFVGQAGRLLGNMLAAIGMNRERGIYIANVLKCRPPGNRNPEPVEVARCGPHLRRQIELVQPRLLVAMGRFAAQTLLSTDASIASMRGRLFQYEGVPVVVTYHPAYLLRNLPDKAKAWEDLLFIRRTLAARG